MNESEMAKKILEQYGRRRGRGYDWNVELEVPYNYYGDRGYIDVHIQRKTTARLVELKSESAVENATGANEIIRQARKHQEYFFKGSDYENQGMNEFSILFDAGEYCLRHIHQNASAYGSWVSSNSDWQCEVGLLWDKGHSTEKIIMLNQKVDYRDVEYTIPAPPANFQDYIKEYHSDFYENHSSIANVITLDTMDYEVPNPPDY